MPWTDPEPTPRRLAETLSDHLGERDDLDVSCVIWEPPAGAMFTVRYDTGVTLRVTVVTAEPSPRFYPDTGEPDDRERADFAETFEEE